MESPYLFTSERLGFRNWVDTDIPLMTAISADPEVMEYFPAPATPEQTLAFINRMKQMFADEGYCYFAVDLLATGNFIGFIGLCKQTYEASFTPCVDIGWRLDKAFWNHGYATEGAKRCLQFGFEQIGLTNIKAIATATNLKSFRVMEKIGMRKQLAFQHPMLIGDPRLANCFCYEI
jgi:RimJ/RimL family protein N-acetyltransferase